MEGMLTAQTIRQQLEKAFQRLLLRRLFLTEVVKVTMKVHEILNLLASKADKFNMQWNKVFLEHPQIQWPQIVFDLLTCTPNQNAAIT